MRKLQSLIDDARFDARMAKDDPERRAKIEACAERWKAELETLRGQS
jgi:hypothetical protein